MSIMCEFYCIAFIEYMVAGKTLLDYTNLFSSNDYKKNDKIIYIIIKIDRVEEASLFLWNILCKNNGNLLCQL